MRARIGIHEDRRGIGDPNGLGGSEESIGGGDAFIARTDSQRHEYEPHGIGSIADSDRIFHLWGSGQLLLEALEHRAHHVLAALQNFRDARIDLSLDTVVLLYVTVKGHLHTKKMSCAFAFYP